MNRDDIAALGREEHEFRESRRKAKRDLRRGKKSKASPKSLRARRAEGKLNVADLPSSPPLERDPNG